MGGAITGVEARARAEAIPHRAATVIVVSDVLLYREGLRASLSERARIEVVDSVTGPDALPAITARCPHAVLMDTAMDECLALARQIRAIAPEIKVVGFAITGGVDRMAECAESGIAAFVDCNGDVEDLVRSIVGALSGELFCSPKLSAVLCERVARLSAGSGKSLSLTHRERQIAALVGHGFSNKEIANDLNIGAATVKNHVHSILGKLNVKRRSAIMSRLGGAWSAAGSVNGRAGTTTGGGNPEELTLARGATFLERQAETDLVV